MLNGCSRDTHTLLAGADEGRTWFMFGGATVRRPLGQKYMLTSSECVTPALGSCLQ